MNVVDPRSGVTLAHNDLDRPVVDVWAGDIDGDGRPELVPTFTGGRDVIVVGDDLFPAWTWQIPDQLGRLSLNHPMWARASIDIYSNDRYTGYFSIIIPVHLGFVFIPRDVVEKINQNIT